MANESLQDEQVTTEQSKRHSFSRFNLKRNLLISAVVLSTFFGAPGTSDADTLLQQGECRISVSQANLREGPRLVAGIMARMNRGGVIQTLDLVEGDEYNGSTQWYRVALEDGRNVYIHSQLVNCNGDPGSNSSSSDWGNIFHDIPFVSAYPGIRMETSLEALRVDPNTGLHDPAVMSCFSALDVDESNFGYGGADILICGAGTNFLPDGRVEGPFSFLLTASVGDSFPMPFAALRDVQCHIFAIDTVNGVTRVMDLFTPFKVNEPSGYYIDGFQDQHGLFIFTSARPSSSDRRIARVRCE